MDTEGTGVICLRLPDERARRLIRFGPALFSPFGQRANAREQAPVYNCQHRSRALLESGQGDE